MKNSNFPILFLEIFCWNLKLPPTGWVFCPIWALSFLELTLSFLKTHKKMPPLFEHIFEAWHDYFSHFEDFSLQNLTLTSLSRWETTLARLTWAKRPWTNSTTRGVRPCQPSQMATSRFGHSYLPSFWLYAFFSWKISPIPRLGFYQPRSGRSCDGVGQKLLMGFWPLFIIFN